MEPAPLIIIAVLGLCLGVLLATVRIPETQWIPFLSLILLTVGSVFALRELWQAGLTGGLVLLAGILLGSSCYAGRLWQRLDMEPGVSYLQWAWRDLLHQGYLRRLYRAQRTQRQALEQSETAR